MKRIILFMLLFAVICCGQDKIEYHYEFGDCTEPIMTIVDKDTMITTINPYQVIVILTLLQLLEEYEKECYADSTFLITGGGPDIKHEVINDTLDLTKSMFVNAIYIVKSRWIHREPTLQGFIEFLRNKCLEEK